VEERLDHQFPTADGRSKALAFFTVTIATRSRKCLRAERYL